MEFTLVDELAVIALLLIPYPTTGLCRVVKAGLAVEIRKPSKKGKYPKNKSGHTDP
jgi:hypothetical protein